MAMLMLLATCIILLGSWIILFRMRRRRLYELADRLRGPPQLPFIGHLHRFIGNSEDIMTSIKEISYLAAHEGGIAKLWIGPTFFCLLVDPVDIEFVLKSCLEKDKNFAEVFRDATGNGMGFALASVWHRRRKAAAPAFAAKNLAQFVKVFAEQSETMLQELAHIGTGEFDIFPHFASYSMKSILGVALGVDTEARKDHIASALDAISRTMEILCARIFYPWLNPKWLFRLTPYFQTYRKCLSFAYTFMDDIILEGKQKIKRDALEKYQEAPLKPFLSLLMRPMERGTGYRVALGVDTEARKDHIASALDAISRTMEILCARIFYPWLNPKWLFRLTPYFQAYRKCLSFAYTFMDDIILEGKQKIKRDALEKYLDQEAPLKPFLSLLMRPMERGTGYSDLELREEILLMAIAATDTSAVGACFTLMLLGRHQDVQDKVYSELLDVFGKSERPLVKEDLYKLCYLEQVIKESLRLYPPAPLISRECDREISLRAVLPAGCGIPISIWGVHRNPAYWGADAELFRPERFSPERYNPRHACVYMPFSAGPRNCIGLQYAMMSLKTSLATILRRYRVRAPADCSSNIRVKFEIMMKPVEGFHVSLDERR